MRGLILAGVILLSCCTAWAQTPDCLQTIAAQRRLLNDWGGLTRYGSDNSELRKPAAGEERVVFLGDEITESWSPKFFAGKPYINRGIRGQTTPQMLVRFRQDVILLAPKVVVILAGSNDIAGLAGPATEGTMADNFASMMDLAQSHGIRVVLASVTPVCDCFTNQTTRRSQGRIAGINGWLRDFAARSGGTYLDYYSLLAEGRNFKKELTSDGLLPNEAGYAVMAAAAQKAIAEALLKK